LRWSRGESERPSACCSLFAKAPREAHHATASVMEQQYCQFLAATAGKSFSRFTILGAFLERQRYGGHPLYSPCQKNTRSLVHERRPVCSQRQQVSHPCMLRRVWAGWACWTHCWRKTGTAQTSTHRTEKTHGLRCTARSFTARQAIFEEM
jgi:hypothetical protein